MIDSHAHLLPPFVKNCEELIEKARKKGVKAIINSAIEPKHYNSLLFLSKKHPDVLHNSMGISPSHLGEIDINFAFSSIQEHSNDIVAVGEVGLDYYWVKDHTGRRKQKEVFSNAISLAIELEKGLVVHSRNAESDCIDILEKNAGDCKGVLLHCFSGSVDEALKIIENSWLISIPTAVVNRRKHKKLAKRLPLSSLVVETDTPFLSPVPGIKNEPAFVSYAIKEIANLKGETFDEVCQVTTKNAQNLFQI